jgi:hypothetical protein
VRPEFKPLLWIGAATLAAVLVIGFVRTGKDLPDQPLPGMAQDPTEAAPRPPARAAGDRVAVAGPLPWQRGLAGDTASVGTAPRDGQAMDRAQFMATMQTQLQRNQAAADAALQRIAEVQASGQVPEGVDLDALRDNLLIAKQAQSLAMELARTGAEPDSPARAQKVAAITSQLQLLQARLQQSATVAAPHSNSR